MGGVRVPGPEEKAAGNDPVARALNAVDVHLLLNGHPGNRDSKDPTRQVPDNIVAETE